MTNRNEVFRVIKKLVVFLLYSVNFELSSTSIIGEKCTISDSLWRRREKERNE